jgi:hypothetical protein
MVGETLLVAELDHREEASNLLYSLIIQCAHRVPAGHGAGDPVLPASPWD